MSAQNILPDSDEEYSEVDLIGGLFVTPGSKRKRGSVKRSWVDDDEYAASSADVATATACEVRLQFCLDILLDCQLSCEFAWNDH